LSPVSAVYREGCGCTLAVDTSVEDLVQQCQEIARRPTRNSSDVWPRGERIDLDNVSVDVDQDRLQAIMQEAFQEPNETSMRNTQAIVIVYKDRIIAEKYQEPFTKDTLILARIVRDMVGGTLADVINFTQRELFDPIGMVSAIIEADASGSLVGSSYMNATTRDWVRYGVLIKNDGVWNCTRTLPEGWVQCSLTPTPLAPKG
jgi:hypothetical protein